MIARGLRNYGYTLLALALTGGIGAGLTFALYSGVRHVLWRAMMMPRSPIPWWIWADAAVPAVLACAYGYRLATAIVRQGMRSAGLNRELESRLSPFDPAQVPDDLARVADWYWVEDNEPYAVTWGAISLRVAISRGLWNSLDERSRLAVMYHESQHVKSRDPLQQHMLQTLARAFPFSWMKELTRRQAIHKEIAADAKAISHFRGDSEPLAIALLTAVRGHGAGVGLSESFEERVHFLETRQEPTPWDVRLAHKLAPSVAALIVTIGQGILAWCR